MTGANAGMPLYSTGMNIAAPQYCSPNKPLHLPTIGIIDLHNDEIDTTGFPAQSLRVTLQGIYAGCLDRIMYAEVKFGDLSKPHQLKKVKDRQEAVLKRMAL